MIGLRLQAPLGQEVEAGALQGHLAAIGRVAPQTDLALATKNMAKGRSPSLNRGSPAANWRHTAASFSASGMTSNSGRRGHVGGETRNEFLI